MLFLLLLVFLVIVCTCRVIQLAAGCDNLLLITFKQFPSEKRSDLSVKVQSMTFNVNKTFVTEILEYVREGMSTWSAEPQNSVERRRAAASAGFRRGRRADGRFMDRRRRRLSVEPRRPRLTRELIVACIIL